MELEDVSEIRGDHPEEVAMYLKPERTKELRSPKEEYTNKNRGLAIRFGARGVRRNTDDYRRNSGRETVDETRRLRMYTWNVFSLTVEKRLELVVGKATWYRADIYPGGLSMKIRVIDTDDLPKKYTPEWTLPWQYRREWKVSKQTGYGGFRAPR